MKRGAADFRDRNKILELSQALDQEKDIYLPKRLEPLIGKWEPKTFTEVAKKPTSMEYKRLFDSHYGVLVRDLYRR